MKTAEEILESHLTSMLSRTKESYATIDEMKQIPEWEACVNAIEQAQKESYNQALEDAVENVIMKLLNGIIVIDKDSILKLKK